MTDVHKLMCMPADKDPGIRDSASIRADCGHQVWIAPSGLNLVLNPTIETKTMCLRCVPPEELVEAVRQSRLHEVPGQREELGEEIGHKEADDLLRRLRLKRLGE